MLLVDTVSRAMKEAIAEFLFVTIFLDGVSDVGNLSQRFIVLPDVKQNGDARELMICFQDCGNRAVMNFGVAGKGQHAAGLCLQGEDPSGSEDN